MAGTILKYCTNLAGTIPIRKSSISHSAIPPHQLPKDSGEAGNISGFNEHEPIAAFHLL